MQVTIEINGRQALPVRAIPLLTYWETLSPDVCANAFAGNECTAQHLAGLPTYRLDDKGEPQPVAALEWANYHVRALNACSAHIKATQPDHEVGYQQWRSESLGLLPAGVFVWRDEFESAFLLEYGPESMRARFAGANYEQDRHQLNFDPQYGPRNDWKTLVLEGFESVQPQAAAPAPAADSASNNATTDPERRLARLHALGGSATYRRNEWKFTGIKALVAIEKSEGRKRSSEKTIRGDLKEAAQTELEAKRAGFAAGLGQR